MTLYSQSIRPLRVTTPLGPDALLLVGLSGHEAISSLFHFRLDLRAENETAVSFEKLLGQKVVVELGFPDQDVRYLTGICSSLGQAGRDQTFTSYHMEVVPQLWFLTRIAQSRIVQQLSVPEILARVFKGLDVDMQLTGQYEPRDYCVQYRETDFNFASRLMEEEGIFYFFRHSARGHTLVVADSPQSFPELPEPLIFDEAFSAGMRDEERIGAWEKTQELRSGKVTLWDHCFELPHKHLEAEKTIQDSVAAGQVTHKLKIDGGEKLELYDYPGEYAQRFDGVNPGGGDRPADIQKIFTDNERTVALRMQEAAASGLVIRGSGNVRALGSGSKFELQGHYDADGSYLLTSVEHSARLTSSYRSGDLDPYHYSASFRCIPAALPYRPARTTPRPFVQGTQTAVVVGPPGEEIFTDKYGRVKVQFHWDRQGKLDANSSCWVRVGTPWAGRNWGAIHIPRIGQEVIVAFEEGDPDRPIIVGSVYNADQMPPHALPAGKVSSGIKSNSTPGGGGYNEMTFDDTKGNEKITVHGQYDMATTIEHDDTQHIKNDRTITVDGKHTETIEKDTSITIKIGNFTHEVKTGTAYYYVKSAVEEKFDATMKATVKGAVQEEYQDSLDTIVKNGIHIASLTAHIYIHTATSIQLHVGKSSIWMDEGGQISIKGMNVSIEGQESVAIKGGRVVSAANTTHEIQGGNVKSDATGNNVVKGAMVMLNPGG